MARSDDERFRRMRGRKNKALFIARGITRVGLARALGFTSTGAISQAENGLRGLTFGAMVNAAKALGVHPYFLMTPDDMALEDFELISSMLGPLEKRSRQPELVDPIIDELRAVLLKHASFTGGGTTMTP